MPITLMWKASLFPNMPNFFLKLKFKGALCVCYVCTMNTKLKGDPIGGILNLL